MRRALLPALLLLTIAGNAPPPKPTIVDPALVEHLRALEDWAKQFEMTEYRPVSAFLCGPLASAEAMQQALPLYEPLFKEFDALWGDPSSRVRMQSGRLFRPETARLMGARECFNLLAARAIHDGRDLGDRVACQRDCEEALAYSRSLGTDDIGFMIGWVGERILASALRQLACEDADACPAVGELFGRASVPYGLGCSLPQIPEQYTLQSQETRELLAFVAR